MVDSPYRVANIIGNEECASLIDDDPYRTTLRVLIFIDETSQHIQGLTRRLPSLNGTNITL